MQNLALLNAVKKVAARHDATPGQIALAWLHAQGDDVFPIPGDFSWPLSSQAIPSLSSGV